MFRDLDIYQQRAVYTENKNVLIVAPPGSGKTTVIINRAIYLIEEKKVNPDNMIIITFTRAAALNMKSRYLKLTNNRKTPFFGTFHALFYKILSRHLGKINIIKSSDGFRLVNGILVSYLDSVGEEKVKEVLNDISLFKNSGELIEYYKPKIDKSIFIECLKAYENFKSENNLMDFDDLQINAKKLFLNRPELLNSYKRLFKYILIDEFQDCDKLQIELLQDLGDNNSIFAVGDEDQCIYGFRGSRPDCMVDFDKYFNDGKKVFLRMNYRSSEDIVQLSKKLIKNNKTRNFKEIEANKKEKGKINFFNLENEKNQSTRIAELIQELVRENKQKYNNSAVLFRTNLESRSIVDAFLKKDIPFKLLDKEYNFFEHFICKDMIAYLKLSIDTSNKESFIRIINKPFRYISKVNIEKVRRNIVKENCFEVLKNLEDMPIFQMKNIDKLEKDVVRLNKMFLKDAINFIITDLGYYNYIYEYSQKIKIDISELMDVVEEFKDAAEDFNSITSFFVHIDETKEVMSKRAPDENSVILSTIHGVKGMEFDNVFIVNCDEGVVPHINSIPQNIEEERRLFYVAVTRAIKNLNMFSTRVLKGKGKELSRFIGECGLGIKEEVDNRDYVNPYKIGDEVVHKAFGKGKVTAVDRNYIDINFANGTERKFDACILERSCLIINEDKVS
ncbi:ATP-dependent helicase [Clostridium thailandense]|uniref:ATP-dependent helicase n=1 Tax=Clostridium thailandense TaxID=2794346 RepID=UPI0039897959